MQSFYGAKKTSNHKYEISVWNNDNTSILSHLDRQTVSNAIDSPADVCNAHNQAATICPIQHQLVEMNYNILFSISIPTFHYCHKLLKQRTSINKKSTRMAPITRSNTSLKEIMKEQENEAVGFTEASEFSRSSKKKERNAERERSRSPKGSNKTKQNDNLITGYLQAAEANRLVDVQDVKTTPKKVNSRLTLEQRKLDYKESEKEDKQAAMNNRTNNKVDGKPTATNETKLTINKITPTKKFSKKITQDATVDSGNLDTSQSNNIDCNATTLSRSEEGSQGTSSKDDSIDFDNATVQRMIQSPPRLKFKQQVKANL